MVLSTAFLVYLVFWKVFPTPQDQETFRKAIGKCMASNVQTFFLLFLFVLLTFLEPIVLDVSTKSSSSSFGIIPASADQVETGNFALALIQTAFVQSLIAVLLVLSVSFVLVLGAILVATVVVPLARDQDDDKDDDGVDGDVDRGARRQVERRGAGGGEQHTTSSRDKIVWTLCRIAMWIIFYQGMARRKNESFLAAIVVQFVQGLSLTGLVHSVFVWILAMAGWVAVIWAVIVAGLWIVPRIQMWRRREYAHLTNIAELPLVHNIVT